MNLKNILTIYLKELKDSLRDRRTLISTIVIPTVAMPVLFLGAITVARKIEQKNRAQASAVMVLGVAQDSPVIARLQDVKDETGKTALFRLVPPATDYQQQISDKRVRAAVELPANFETALKAGEPFSVSIYNYQGEQASMLASRRLEDFFTKLREQTIETRLTERNLPASLVKPFTLARKNVAPPEKVGGNIFGGLVPYMLIILCFTGAMYPAIDLTAGEKERGTMETLLCSPVHRLNIVLGKFLMVVTASVATIIFSLISMAGSAAFAISYFGTTTKGQAAAKAAVDAAARAPGGGFMPTVDPVGLVGVFAMVAPVAVLFAALLLTISLFAKSYKEAQSYVSPLIIVVLMPAMMGMLPGIELSAKTALVPILNISLACKEMLSGEWHWNYLALIFGSTCVYAGIALGACVKMFNREDVIFRA
jgi:sodium transport system permease protein